MSRAKKDGAVSPYPTFLAQEILKIIIIIIITIITIIIIIELIINTITQTRDKPANTTQDQTEFEKWK